MKEIKGKNTKKPQVYATAASKTNTKSQGQREENRKDSGRLFGGDKESLKDSGRAFGGRKDHGNRTAEKRSGKNGAWKQRDEIMPVCRALRGLPANSPSL